MISNPNRASCHCFDTILVTVDELMPIKSGTQAGGKLRS
jgi:hypothetical protein